MKPRRERGKFGKLGRVLACIVLFTTLAFVSLGTASAATIYVPDDYSKIQYAVNNASDGDTIIVRDGMYYENIVVNKRVVIKSENGTKNCIVNGSGGSYTPVFQVKVDNVGIIGFTVESNGTYIGIHQDYYVNNTLTRDNIIRKVECGITLHQTSGSNVLNNTIENAAKTSMYIYRSKDTRICNNRMLSPSTTPNYHIYMFMSENITIANNTASSASFYGIYLGDSDNNTLTKNNASDNYCGIYLSSSSNNTLTNNTANSNSHNGICISYSDNNTGYKNTADSNMDTGILLGPYSCYNNFYNNNVYSNYYGITIRTISNYNEVHKNTITNNKIGIDVRGYTDHFCRYNNIHDNLLDSNYYGGIEIAGGSNNKIYNNTLHANQGCGIRLECHATDSSVYNNTISSSDYGIKVSQANNSNIYNNTLLNNSMWDIHVYQNSFNNTFTSNSLLSDYPTTISFTCSGDVSVKGVDSPPSDPEGWLNISRFVNASIQGTDAWMLLNVSYNDFDVKGNESTLRMWKFRGGVWSLASSDTGVNPEANYVYANITGASRGIFTPLVNDGGMSPVPRVHNINTSEDFFTIQGAIAATNTTDGHIIEIGDGIYIENVCVNKRLTIRSENGSANCIVCAANPNDNVFDIRKGHVNISGLTVMGANHSAGIYLNQVNGCNISGNNCTMNNRGIYLYNSDNNIITGNNCSNNIKYGIYLWAYSNNNTLKNNTVGSNMYTGIYLTTSSCYNNLYDNIIYNNSNGFWLFPLCDHNRIHDNRIFDHIGDHGDIPSYNRHAIRLYNASYNQIYNNTVYSNYNGITLWSMSNHNEVFRNNITNNMVGITVSGYTDHFSRYNNIHDNLLDSNYYAGVKVESGSNNKIYNNTLHANQEYGIRLEWHATGSSVYNNTIYSSDYGIEVSWTNDSNIYNNTFLNNSRWDIYVYQNSFNNTFTNNSLLSDYPTTISFTYSGDVSVKGVDSPPSDPEGWLNISRFVNATIQGSGAWMQLNVSYNDSDVAGSESTLLMWRYDTRWCRWCLASSNTGVNTEANYVYANITGASRGIFTPLVNAGGVIPAPRVHNINTSEDFFTIHEAIAATNTSDGHIIEVGDGVYIENVCVNKRLTIRSENGSVNCIVCAANPNDPVIEINDDYVNISGLTVMGATGYSAGIYLNRVNGCNILGNNCTMNNRGIHLHDADNNIIKDNTADLNRWYGIYLYNSDNNRVINNSASSNADYIGIYVQHSHGNEIIGNTADNNGWEGIRLYYSDNCTVERNNLSYNNFTAVSTGLVLWASNNAIITNNTVTNNIYGIYLHINASNNTVTNNNASGNEYTGIYVYNSSNAMISNNTANYNRGHGMCLVDSSTENITIRNNTVSHNMYHGIYGYPFYTAAAPSNLTITGNTLIDNGVSDNHGYGIYLRESSGAIISDNYIANNTAQNHAYGIELYAFSNATIHNNTIVNNGDYGIILDSVSGSMPMLVRGFAGAAVADGRALPPIESGDNVAPPAALALLDDDYTSTPGMQPSRSSLSDMGRSQDGVNLSESRIAGNAGGIWLNSCDNVTIVGNNVTTNGIGINLTFSSGNTIYNNYFDNMNNARDNGNNIWNITKTNGTNIIGGPYLSGNYWSDYAGADTDGDGLGDTLLPYNSSGGIINGGDWHPLTEVATSLSDLEITKAWVCWHDNCTICYNVTNIGKGTAPAGHNTILFVDGEEVTHDLVVVDLAPNASYTGCFKDYNWTYTPPDDNITVCADNNNIVAESNETNNCFTNMWKCGDVNMDGEVTIGDVRKVWNRYLDPNYALELPWAADVNCDGDITIGDVRKVWNRYLDPGYELNCCCGTDLFFYKNIHGERRR